MMYAFFIYAYYSNYMNGKCASGKRGGTKIGIFSDDDEKQEDRVVLCL